MGQSIGREVVIDELCPDGMLNIPVPAPLHLYHNRNLFYAVLDRTYRINDDVRTFTAP